MGVLAEPADTRRCIVNGANHNARSTSTIVPSMPRSSAPAPPVAHEPQDTPGGPPVTRRSPLADPKWGLVWSNPNLSDEVLVRNALAHGKFDLLLQAVLGHGLDYVRARWTEISPALPARAREEVERKLRNIELGLQSAR